MSDRASHPVVLETSIPELPVRRGKVRDVYDLGDRLLVVSTDRISAFDWILPTGIPDKGRVLTGMSAFWFDVLGVHHHLLSLDVDQLDLPASADRQALRGRSMLVRKANVVPIECVVRGYLAGSGWKEYQKWQSVCGVKLPAGLVESSELDEPIFTPATKAESGHDENISQDAMAAIVGKPVAKRLAEASLDIYRRARERALRHGIIIADTKLEWGFADGELLLIDEVLTPDSSRFWPANTYEPGRSQASFDKQFVRDWLETTDWDKNSPPPALPPEVAARTREKYLEAGRLLTGRDLAAD